MKKTGLFRKTFLAAAGAAAWLGISALGAIELQVDPAIGSKTDGVYVSAKPLRSRSISTASRSMWSPGGCTASR